MKKYIDTCWNCEKRIATTTKPAKGAVVVCSEDCKDTWEDGESRYDPSSTREAVVFE